MTKHYDYRIIVLKNFKEGTLIDEYNNMNPDPNGSPEPQQPDYASQYSQPQQPDYANQYNQQPQQPDDQQYGQQQPDYNAQYNQQPDYGVQQQYGQYDNYPQQQYSQPVNNYNVQGDTYSGAVRAFSIVSLVCGIIALALSAVFGGFYFGVPAIVFSILAKKKYSGKNGMATVGLVFGIVAAAISTIFLIVVASTGTRIR